LAGSPRSAKSFRLCRSRRISQLRRAPVLGISTPFSSSSRVCASAGEIWAISSRAGSSKCLPLRGAWMTNPALMLLDQPVEGLARVIVDDLTAAMKTMLSDRRIAIILVGQHTDIALELTAEAIVLERGAVAHRAPSAQLQKDTATLERLVGLRVAATA